MKTTIYYLKMCCEQFQAAVATLDTNSNMFTTKMEEPGRRKGN